MDTNLRITTNKSTDKTPKVSTELLYPELSYKITGICFTVHNELGQFAREKQYGDLIEEKLTDSKLNFERERQIADSGNILDFIVENSIVLELKAKRIVLANDYRQIQNYLQESGLRLGLLVNFRNKYLKPARIIRIEKYMVK
jgi:GxxExxY protein